MKNKIVGELNEMRQALGEKYPDPKKVAIWIRVSTDDQAKGESPQQQ